MTEVQCIRSGCIQDPNDEYHWEPHRCFVCGAPFFVSPNIVERCICEQCNWAICPVCGGCKCSLSEQDQAWIDNVRETVCQSVQKMANVDPEMLADTDNGWVKKGLGLQLYFCKKWACVQLQAKKADA